VLSFDSMVSTFDGEALCGGLGVWTPLIFKSSWKPSQIGVSVNFANEKLPGAETTTERLLLKSWDHGFTIQNPKQDLSLIRGDVPNHNSSHPVYKESTP
jgi:hypothetical protein